MPYQPQRFNAADGTALVVLLAADYERLQMLAEDREDILGASAIEARIAGGEGTMPQAFCRASSKA